MKTTLDLPDDLLIEAKATAAKRRTTLRAMIEHALRRELGEINSPVANAQSPVELNERGFPIFKRAIATPGKITSEQIYAMLEDADMES